MYKGERLGGQSLSTNGYYNNLSAYHDNVDANEIPVSVKLFKDVEIVIETAVTGQIKLSLRTLDRLSTITYLYRLNICIQT